MNARNWIDIEPGKHSLSAYEVSKKVIHLLRHSQQVHREEDGAVHFWSIKENLQNQFPQIPHWSDDRWKACLAAGGGAKRRFQYCTDDSGIIVYFRALQGHSGRNLIDLSFQDNVVIQGEFFQPVYHIGCAFNLHSIINSGLIPGGQNSSKRQTVFFLPVDPRDKSHKDPKSNWWLRSNKTGSNIVPEQRRPDFKQALSTLQQLKQKEEEAQRNQQWAQSSSSSSWWSWQGSWWTPYSCESHHRDKPSTD